MPRPASGAAANHDASIYRKLAGYDVKTSPRSCRDACWLPCARTPCRYRRRQTPCRSAVAACADSTAAPDVLADLVENLADFLDGAGAEGDADIGDAARRMQVEIEFGAGAAEPADIDDAALDFGGREILARDLARDLIDDQVDAFAADVACSTWSTQPGSDWNPPQGRRRTPSGERGASRRWTSRSRAWRP